MARSDYYKVLEVSKTATADEIRKAYRRLSRQYHPDMKPDDKAAEEKFKEIQQAYEVLGNADKRKQYDQFGHAAFESGAGGPRSQTHTWTGGQGGQPFDLNDLFGGQVDLGDLFGGAFRGGGAGGSAGGQRASRASRGQDLEMEAVIPFHVAVEGGQHEIVIPKGHRRERLTIKVPPGVDSGSTIRLAGQGEPAPGQGKAGDLLLQIKVAPHPYFRREGKQILIDVPLTITEASLGAKIEVPTVSEGMVSLKIPAGTSSGTKLRLKGKGVLDRQTHQRGDQLVVVKIVPPTSPSHRARELLEELQQVLDQTPRAGLWS